MYTFQFYYTIVILAIAIFVIAKEWLQAEVVFFGALITLIIGKTITVNEAFAGFSNQGMLTIGILFVVAGALYNTGALELFNVLLFSRGKSKGISRQILRISFPTAAASAFTNNTPLVAMMIPTVRSWAEKQDLAPSKFLIPASYAAILGGMCTLIGTSTTLVVHGLLIESGEPGFSFFEISKVGVPVALTGLIFLWIFGNRLLPDRKEPIVKLGENTREFVIGLKVTAAYKNIGKTIEEGKLRHLKGLFLFQIVRNGDVIAPAGPDERIREGDRLFFTGLPKTILELQRTPGLQLIKESSFDLKRYDSDRVKTYEAVVSPSSPLVGKNVRESNFRSTYGAVNTAGVMPIIFAQSIMFIPSTFGTFFPSNEFVTSLVALFDMKSPLYWLIYGLMIVFFTYFYTAIVFNPVDIAENMQKYGGFIPGVRPGKKTSEYLDYILTRITLPGSVFLAIIAIFPYFIMKYSNVSYNFASFYGGTGLLIVVGVALDTLQQVESHLLMRHYDGFMKTGRLRGKRRA